MPRFYARSGRSLAACGAQGCGGYPSVQDCDGAVPLWLRTEPCHAHGYDRHGQEHAHSPARGTSDRAGRPVRAIRSYRPLYGSVLRPRSGPCSERSEEHPSELHSLMRITYAVFYMKTNTAHKPTNTTPHTRSH